MKSTTCRAIKAIIDSDPSVTMDQRSAIHVVIGNPDVLPHVVKRDAAARLLSVSTTRIDQLARSGVLRRVVAPGYSRAIGIASDSIRMLLTGNQQMEGADNDRT